MHGSTLSAAPEAPTCNSCANSFDLLSHPAHQRDWHGAAFWGLYCSLVQHGRRSLVCSIITKARLEGHMQAEQADLPFRSASSSCSTEQTACKYSQCPKQSSVIAQRQVEWLLSPSAWPTLGAYRAVVQANQLLWYLEGCKHHGQVCLWRSPVPCINV